MIFFERLKRVVRCSSRVAAASAVLPVMLCLLINYAEAQNSGNSRASGAMGAPPEFTFKDRSSYDHLRKAFSFEQSGNFAAAINEYKEILKVEPYHVMVLYSIAGNYGSLQKYNEQVAWSKKAIAAGPYSVPAYINFGNGYCGLGQFGPAREAYNKAVTIAPNDPVGYYSLGLIEEQLQNWEKAESWYRRSVEADPNFSNGHFNLAVAYANQRKFEFAIRELEKVIALDPNAQDAKDMLSELKSRTHQP